MASIPEFEPDRFDVVAIGASTGAPALVQKMLAGLPADLPVSILVAQHMPPMFTESFARAIALESPLAVYHAEQGMAVVPGTVYIGRGRQHLRLSGSRGAARLVVSEEPKELPYKPSADELFRSCVRLYGRKVLAIVMSGIGRDGASGAREVRDAGGVVLTQSEATCAVYGMPRACDREGLSTACLSPEELRLALLQLSPGHGGSRSSAE